MSNFQHKSGLWLPQGMEFKLPTGEQLEKAQRANEEGKQGKFFSDYSRASNLQYAGAYERPQDEPNYDWLWMVSYKSLIDRVIIDARIAEMKAVARRVVVAGKQKGFRVVHENHSDPNWKVTEEVKRRCDEMERVIDTANPAVHPAGFRDFAVTATEAELVLDRKCMVLFRDRRGKPVKFHLVDGATVRPRIMVLAPFMMQQGLTNEDTAAQILSETHKIDLTNAAWIQVVDSQITAAWRAEEMSVDVTNPSVKINRWAYGGGSILQKSLEATSAFVNAWKYNAELFKQNYPEAVLAVLGDYDPAGLESFKRQVLGEVGPGSNWRLPVIPGDKDFKIELHKLRDTPKDMLFGELLRIIVAIKCASYRMHPSTINFSIDGGNGTPLVGSKGNDDSQTTAAYEEGFVSICDSLSDWLTRAIVKPRYDDLKVVFEVQQENEANRIELLTKKADKYMTLDEVRAADDLPPMPDGKGEHVLNPTYVSLMQMMMQQQQMEQQAAMQEGGDFGQEGGEEQGWFGDEDQDGDQGEGENAEGDIQNSENVPAEVEQQEPIRKSRGNTPKPVVKRLSIRILD